MKSLFVLALLCALPMPLAAQYSCANDVAIDPYGNAQPGVQIYVCDNNTSGRPCTPQASIYGVATGSLLTQPITTDSLGRYKFCASPGLYHVQRILGSSVTDIQDFTIALTAGNEGTGTVTTDGDLTQGQRVYASGATIIKAEDTDLSVDTFAGSDICIKAIACIAAQASTGGKCTFAQATYPACAGTSGIPVAKDNITLTGAGMGNFAAGTGATVLNFPAGSRGIYGTAQGLVVEDMVLKSASTVLGTDDGLTFGGGSPACRRVVVKGFGRDGVVMNENTDLWELSSCYSDHNKRDGFRFTAGNSDSNVGTARSTSATSNGGVGYNILSGVSNLWLVPHASSNTGGDYVVNTSYNTFIGPYAEIGTGSSFTLGGGQGYNRIFVYAFGQPTTITDNGVAGTNQIQWDAFGGTDGQYPAQNSLSLTGPPQNSPVAFYSWVADGGTYGAQELVLRDRLNTINIYDYVPGVGHSFLKDVILGIDNSIAGKLIVSNGSILAHTTIGTGATANRIFNFPDNAGTTGDCLKRAVTTGSTTWDPTCGTGITNSAPNTVIPKSDGTNLVSSSLTDGTALVTTKAFSALSLSTGSSPPAGCSGGGCIALSETGVVGTPTSGVDYLRADLATHSLLCSLNGAAESACFSGGGGGGITNTAPANVFPLSDGTNIVTSTLSTDGTTTTSTQPINAPSLSLGSSLPVSCGAANGIWCAKESGTAGSPTSGESYIRADSITHTWRQSLNGAAEALLGNPGTVTNVTCGNLSPLFTCSVGTASTTPALSFSGTSQSANLFFSSPNGSSGVPSFRAIVAADVPTLNQNTSGTAANLSGTPTLPNGTKCATQSPGDNTTNCASTAFVTAAVATGVGTGFNGGAGTTYQDALEIAAPSAPAALSDRLWVDSTTHTLKCKTSASADCMPAAGAASWTSLTGGDNSSSAFVLRSGGSLKINFNTASLASPLTGTLLQAGQADGVIARYELDSFAAASFFSGVRANTTAAAPSSLVTNDPIVGMSARGYDGSNYVGPQASFGAYASQNWTNTHLGTFLRLFTTPNNSTTLTEALTVENDGGVTLPSTVTGGSKGAGTINATGLYVAGVSVHPPTCDPWNPAHFCIIEDFFGGSTPTLQIGTNNWSITTIGAAGSVSIPASSWPHLGIRSLNTNAAATQGQGETLSLQIANPDLGNLAANTNWAYSGTFQLQETSTSVFRMGFMNTASVIRPTSFIGIRYDVNSPLSAQAITSIVCTTTVCTVTNAGGTMLLPGQSMTISGASCPTRTVNGTQVMTVLTSATVWKFNQSGAAETCGTPGTVSSVPESTFKFYTQNTSTPNATVTDTGVSADTSWHTFTVTSTVAGTLVFVLDGGSPITISTNAATGIVTLGQTLGVDSTVVALKSVYIDRISFAMTGLTGR